MMKSFFCSYYRFLTLIVSLWAITVTQHAMGQQVLSVKDVLFLVQSQQPQLAGYKEQANAAGYNVKIAKNTMMPEVTAGYQAGYATYNNITGMSYPGLILPISGPPSSGNVYDPVPGTALGAMVKWNPLTFGQRQAAVEKAAAEYRLANSFYNDALFRQQYMAIATYLNAVYLQRLVESYKANIARTRAGLEQSLVYAAEGLRPGIDTTQFQAALAQAETELLNTQGQYYRELTELSRIAAISASPDNISLSDTLLATQLPLAKTDTLKMTDHPLFRYYEAKKEVSEAALKEVQRLWRPRLDIWANAYARGSGVGADGTVDKANGWSLTRKNYGAGIQVSFPILQFTQVSLQKKQHQATVKAATAEMGQVTLNLQKQQEIAQFNYRQSLLVARQSTVQSQAARYAYDGLTLSYQSGLIDFTRLIQGQYDLLKAETNEAGALLQAWRALLEISIANGNLEEFTGSIK